MEQNKKAIVVVSFGTTYEDARRSCIEVIEQRIEQAFPEYDCYRAFTANFVIKRLAERDHIYVDHLKTVLDKLHASGYSEVIIQPTHLTPGEEYEKKVLAVAQPYQSLFSKLVIGRPLLYFTGEDGKPDDFSMTVSALGSQIPEQLVQGQTIVLMGHGSPHQHNPAYKRMQEYLDAAGINGVVGVVEESDYPNFEDMLRLLAAKQSNKIILMPLLLVAGDHANQDMAGDDEESWKNKFIAEGYEVEVYLHGLGENKEIQDLYVQHVHDAIAGLI